MARKLGPRTPAQVPQPAQRQLNMSSPSRRSFGVPNALGIQHDAEIQDAHDPRRPPRRASWIRPNILSVLTNQGDEPGVKSPTSERPPIPSALHVREPDATPLPVLSMIVLSIVSEPIARFLPDLSPLSRPCLGSSCPQTYQRPSCSSWSKVCPHLARYRLTRLRRLIVPGFNEFQDESDIAFYTGVLGQPASSFTLGHTLTSLVQWLHSFLLSSSHHYYGCVITILRPMPGSFRRHTGYCR